MSKFETTRSSTITNLSVVERRSIGGLLIDMGKLTAEDGERVLRYAREKGLRFGDAAIELKLVRNEDIQLALSQQFDYPYLLPGQGEVAPEVIAAWSPFNSQVESLRALRSQLLLRWFGDERVRHSLSVVSVDRGDGRSYLAANLAVVFSQMGERTLLIDADLRNPSQHKLFGLSAGNGLSAILADRSDTSAIQRIPSFVHLCVLPAGPIPPNPLELLARDSFSQLISDLSGSFDVIIVDTPASSVGTDSQLIAKACGGAIAVARKDHTKMSRYQDLVQDIAESGATVIGSLLNAR